MVIGKFQLQASRPTSMKDCVTIALDEALTAMEESFYDLTDEQAQTLPLPGRNNIMAIVLHLQENADKHCCLFQTGALVLDHEKFLAIWKDRSPEAMTRQENLVTIWDLRDRQHRLREAAMEGLKAASNDDLLGARAGHDMYWWQEHHRKSVDAYLRVICHINAHVRQIWALRAALGAVGEREWPEQHYH
jgi:hypothetical protein